MLTNHLHRDRTIVYNCKYHVVFCPKYRRSVLVPPINSRIKKLVLEKQDKYHYRVVEMEVMEDQVVEWLLDHAKITDQPISFSDLMKPE